MLCFFKFGISLDLKMLHLKKKNILCLIYTIQNQNHSVFEIKQTSCRTCLVSEIRFWKIINNYDQNT